MLDARTESIKEVTLAKADSSIEELERFIGAGNPGPKIGHGWKETAVLASRKTVDTNSMVSGLVRGEEECRSVPAKKAGKFDVLSVHFDSFDRLQVLCLSAHHEELTKVGARGRQRGAYISFACMVLMTTRNSEDCEERPIAGCERGTGPVTMTFGAGNLQDWLARI